MIHCYKLCDYNIILDVASGSIHSVDDVVYDVIRMYELILDGKDQSVLIERVMQLHPEAKISDIIAIIADVEKLISQGKLYTPDEYEPVATAPKDMPVKALCLNVSHACNMNCAYCFVKTQGDGSVVSFSPLYGNSCCLTAPKTTQQNRPHDILMSLETGKQAIDFLIKNSGSRKTLDIDFFGGEPLLNWQTVKDLVAYARELEKNTDKKIRFTLTTNGLLIDDDVISFTNKEMHNVVLSLDGRPETHDKMRKLTDNTSSSYEAVLPKIKKLVEDRRGKGYYIRGTYTRENMDFVNDILHLADLGFKEISLEPAVTRPGDPLGFANEDLPELLRQYDMLAVEMRKRKQTRIHKDKPMDCEFNFYHYMLDLEGGPCIHKRIAGCGVATEYLAVTPSGELYPCHQFIGDKAYLMGDVWRGITNRALQTQFKAANIYTREQCKTCWARFYCSGGCAANAYHASGSIKGTHDFGCELFKKRIENAIMLKF